MGALLPVSRSKLENSTAICSRLLSRTTALPACSSVRHSAFSIRNSSDSSTSGSCTLEPSCAACTTLAEAR
eukprot:1581342-Rhodomonas_salina.1